MKTNRIIRRAKYFLAAAIWLIGTTPTTPAQAANECNVKYAYATSLTTSTSKNVSIDAGKTKHINQSNVLYVENLNSQHVRAYRSGVGNFIELSQNGRDPAGGNYTGNITLQKLKCLSSSGSSPTYQTPDAMISALKAAGGAVNDIAAAVVATFGVGGEQLASLLKAAGYDGLQVAGALNSAVSATAAQATSSMKTAGYTVAQMANALKSTYGKTGQEIAELLKAAQFDAGQVASALKNAFSSATNGQMALWLRAAGYQAGQSAAALNNQLNLAGTQLVQALKEAGFTAAEIGGALTSQFNTAAVDMAKWLKHAGYSASEVAGVLAEQFNDSASLMGEWLKHAGYPAVAIAEVLKNSYGLDAALGAVHMKNLSFGAHDTASSLRSIFDATAQQTADLLAALFDLGDQAIRSALKAAGYRAAQIEAALTPPVEVGGVIVLDSFYGPSSSNGAVVPIYVHPQPLTYEVRGAGLTAITSITKLPLGATVQIGYKEDSRLRLTIAVPALAQIGRTGTADLFAGGTKVGEFDWMVEAMPEAGNRDAGSGITAPAPTSSLPDIAPTTFVNPLYRVGSATTADLNGNTYTALDPFNNSPFCQGISEGSVTRDNKQTANRSEVTVPDIRWGVRNTSSVNITTAFTVRLLRGRQELASQRVSTLAAGQQVEFNYARPQSTTTVARVGLGGGCYHAGLQGEGWNDNAGFQVRVDTDDEVDESNENNNNGSI